MNLGDIYLVKIGESEFAPHICYSSFYNASEDIVTILRPVKLTKDFVVAKKGKKIEQLLILNGKADTPMVYFMSI